MTGQNNFENGESHGSASHAGAYSAEELQTAHAFIAECHGTLVKIARAQRRRSRLRDTMLTGDLLHEAILRIGGRANWSSRGHFERAMALAMRHVVIDRAREKLTLKRGGGAAFEPLDEDQLLPHYNETPEQLVAIGQALSTLQNSHPRWVRIIDARYFAGLTEEECADALGLSARTVRRDWKDAKRWLAQALGLSK